MITRTLVALLGAAVVSVTPLAAQQGTTLVGTVLDAATGDGVQDAIFRITRTSASAVSDSAGHFVLRGIPVGSSTLEVGHAAYGNHQIELAVPSTGGQFAVTVHLSSAGMSVDLAAVGPVAPPSTDRVAAIPIAVFDQAVATGPARRSGTVIERDRIQQLAGASRNMGDLIRRAIPALRPRDSDDVAGEGLCLEFGGTSARTIRDSGASTCNSPQIYLDGVAFTDPAAAYAMTSFEEIQWIQALSPAEAGAQFGGTLYGVILITTTVGANRPGAMRLQPGYPVNARRASFDWNLDHNGHDFFRTFLGAAVGNAAGLAAGLEVGRRCVYIEDVTRELDSRCSRGGLVGAGLAALALPALGSSLGARLGGGTDVSVGKWGPGLIGAGMAILPGYMYSLTTVGRGSEATNDAGVVFLLVVTPLLSTAADRLYRTLRAH